MSFITLTTDFGTTDYFVGAMKGAILAVNPKAVIVDITHQVAAHNIRAAAFTLFAAYQTFPDNTIHVAVVDPGVGSERRAILAVADNHYFVAPDNGLLSFVYERELNLRVFDLTNDKYFRQPVSATFHGRDIFAPVAAALSNGVKPEELGEETTDFVRFALKKPQTIDEKTIKTEVINVDHFGNCVVNLKREDLPTHFDKSRFSLEVNNQQINRLQNFYAEANIGEIFLIFGSAGFLEIVAYQASAAKLLKVAIGKTVFIKSSKLLD